jgi:hypothetical protein
MIEIGRRVTTEYGAGEVVDIEHYSRIDGGVYRYGVRLDRQRFFYPVAYFWREEITL